MEVTIHGKKFTVQEGEFNIISGPEWSPLQVRADVAELDREIAFFRELEGSRVFVDYKTTHGGYVPISLENSFQQVIRATDILPEGNFTTVLRVNKGVQIDDLKNYEIVLCDTELDDARYERLKFGNRFLYVIRFVWPTFQEKFQYYIQDEVFTYDNLVHLLMMVKDAGDGFRDILQRNLPFVDRWTILDTGSTDNTVEIIKDVMKSKRGTLYQEPFINFRDSRNRLLDLAGDGYVFNVMLDDTYVLKGGVRKFLTFVRGDDVADSFTLYIKEKDMKYGSNRVTKPEKKLRYKYTIHEIIETNYTISVPDTQCYIEDVSSKYMQVRTKDRKKKDLDYLNQELKENPEDARTYYYMAETYLCMEDWENAAIWYEKRAKMSNGYKEEQQDSIYKFAVMHHFHLNTPWEKCHQLYLNAYRYDTNRCEGLFMIGWHFVKEDRCDELAYMYLKRAFEIGPPPSNYGMNLKIEMYYYNNPRLLIPLAYNYKNYELAEQCCRRLLPFRKEDEYNNWLTMLYYINQNKPYRGQVKQNYTNKKLVCFLIGGGWKEWYGETLRSRGLGGSETCIIRFSENIVQNYGDEYEVVVFCKCGNEPKTYNGVTYIPLDKYLQFVSMYHINVCFINRYPEYIGVTTLNNVNTYLMLHDLPREKDIIPTTHLLRGVILLTKWHESFFLQHYPQFKGRTNVMSYGLEVSEFPEPKTEKFRFIYPSFPHRGLYVLLQVFPQIVERYPEAHLDVFCNTKQDWVRGVAGPMMREIDRMLEEQKDHVTNHGWVNGATLKEYWSRAHIWFYPCTFKETCCLTAFEAAATKTLAVTSDLAALQETVGDRGIMVPGDPYDEGWQIIALTRIFNVLSGVEDDTPLLEKNYTWVSEKKYDTVVADFFQRFIK